MATETRRYELKARAERQEETRQRIAQAAAELHEEIGISRTTVAEIARRAGVSRLTVYNHFPDESELFPACTAHYMAIHPPPDFDRAFASAEPRDRVREVLGGLYRWYRETEPMMSTVNADRGSIPALDEFCKQTWDPQMADLAAALSAGFGARGRRAKRLKSLIALAFEFWTWRRLSGDGLDDDEAAELMTGVVFASAA